MKIPLYEPGRMTICTDLFESIRTSVRMYEKSRELHRIIYKRELSTFFQPILNLQDKTCLGYEVLNRPPLSNRFPSTEDFYDYLGRSNQIFAFERYCRESSIERFEAALKRSEDLPSKSTDYIVFINVHPLVLTDSAYQSGETLRLLDRFGLPPERVIFELTEKQAVTDYAEFERVLSHYRAQGFRIAVDDAGSGYSSLKTIVSLQPEFIKLDKSLIRNLYKHADQQRMVRLLQEFAQGSGTSIIAEGIECWEEAEFLRNEGIAFGQGYALGRPCPELKPACFPCKDHEFLADADLPLVSAVSGRIEPVWK